MQTHRDDDAPNLDELRERAAEMTEAKENEITVGAEGEEAIRSWEHGHVQVVQMPDDPLNVLRVSIGGWHDGQCYAVFRGSRVQCRELLRRAMIALDKTP